MIEILLSLLPVISFLILLIFLDSYKLIKPIRIVLFILSGIFIGILGLAINLTLLKFHLISQNHLIRFLAPISEEILKAIIPIYLIRKNKIAFFVDAAIIGFAVGSGFAIFENLYYLANLQVNNLFFWIIRGFGTAIMHGGTTAIFSILSILQIGKQQTKMTLIFGPGLIFIFIIHLIFNNMVINPLLEIILQILIFPIILMLIFSKSERDMKKWLQIGFDTNMEMLTSLKSSDFKNTKSGKYLIGISANLPPEIIFDIHCYLITYLELAIRSKGVLMMKETGFIPEIEDDIRDKFNELKYLENSIGKTGKKIIEPLLNISVKELWQIYFLEKQ